MKKFICLGSIALMTFVQSANATSQINTKSYDKVNFSKLSLKDKIIAAQGYRFKSLTTDKQIQTVKVMQALSTYKHQTN